MTPGWKTSVAPGATRGAVTASTIDRAIGPVYRASALAYADRGAYLADPAFVDVPVAGLLSPDYAAVRRGLIGDTSAPRPDPSRPALRRSIPRARRPRTW